MVTGQEGQVVTRLPGQLNGKKFFIQQCQKSTILLLDYTETVTVDKCSDCHILIAPCRGRWVGFITLDFIRGMRLN